MYIDETLLSSRLKKVLAELESITAEIEEAEEEQAARDDFLTR